MSPELPELHEVARSLVYWLDSRLKRAPSTGDTFVWEGPRDKGEREADHSSTLQLQTHDWPPNPDTDPILKTHLDFLGWTMEVTERDGRVTVTVRTGPAPESPSGRSPAGSGSASGAPAGGGFSGPLMLAADPRIRRMMREFAAWFKNLMGPKTKVSMRELLVNPTYEVQQALKKYPANRVLPKNLHEVLTYYFTNPDIFPSLRSAWRCMTQGRRRPTVGEVRDFFTGMKRGVMTEEVTLGIAIDGTSSDIRLPMAMTGFGPGMENATQERRPLLQDWVRLHLFTPGADVGLFVGRDRNGRPLPNPAFSQSRVELNSFVHAIRQRVRQVAQSIDSAQDAPELRRIREEWKRSSVVFTEIIGTMAAMADDARAAGSGDLAEIRQQTVDYVMGRLGNSGFYAIEGRISKAIDWREFREARRGAAFQAAQDVLDGYQPQTDVDNPVSRSGARPPDVVVRSNIIGGAWLAMTGGGSEVVQRLVETVSTNALPLAVAGAAVLLMGGIGLILSGRRGRGRPLASPRFSAKMIDDGKQGHLVVPPQNRDTLPVSIDGHPDIEIRWRRGHPEIRDNRPGQSFSDAGPGRQQQFRIPIIVNSRILDRGQWHQINYGETVQIGAQTYTVSTKATSPPRAVTPPRSTPAARLRRNAPRIPVPVVELPRVATPKPVTPPPEPLPPPPPLRVSLHLRDHLSPYVTGRRKKDTQELRLQLDTLNGMDDNMPAPASTRAVGTTDPYKKYTHADPAATAFLDPSASNLLAYTEAFDASVRRHMPEGNVFSTELGRSGHLIYNDGGWFWGGDFYHEHHNPRGRIYLSVKNGNFSFTDTDGKPHELDDSCAAMLYVYLSEAAIDAAKTGHHFGFKVTAKRTDIERADSAVLYFDPKDQAYIYNLMARLSQLDLFKDNTPLFTAQLYGPDGLALRGIAFGQSPAEEGFSFGSKRALIIDSVLREIERKSAFGQSLTPEEIMGRIAAVFQRDGIDTDNPAFEKDGRRIFDYIYHRSTMSDKDENPTAQISAPPNLMPPVRKQ